MAEKKKATCELTAWEKGIARSFPKAVVEKMVKKGLINECVLEE